MEIEDINKVEKNNTKKVEKNVEDLANKANIEAQENAIKSITKKCFNINDNGENQKVEYDIDIKLFILLLKIIFKKQKDNDLFVQFLETKIIRQNAYRINDLNDLIEVICDNNIAKENKWECFCVIAKEIIKIIDTFNNQIEEKKVFNYEEAIEKIISAIENNVEDIKNKESEIQLTFDNIPQDKKIKLSPTSGIQQLNNNPYSFFVNKILDLKQLDKWQMKVDSTIYGNLIHNIAQDFTNCCKRIYLSSFEKELLLFNIDTINNIDAFFKTAITTSFIFKQYWDIIEYNCKKYSIKNNRFFLIKFINIFICLFKIEYEAKKDNRDVFAEKSCSIDINGIIITAKADRIEVDRNKKLIYIYDYKTGDVKTKKNEEQKGEKPQLSIIASILENIDKFNGYKVIRMRYIGLNGTDIANNFADVDLEYIEYSKENLKELVNTFFENRKPRIEKMVFILQNINTIKLYNNEQILHLARETRVS